MNRYLLLLICFILIEIIVGRGRPMTKNGRPDMRYNQNKNDGRLRENRMYGRNLDNSYDMRYHHNHNNQGGLFNSIFYGFNSYNQCSYQSNQCTSTDCWCNGNGYIKKETIDINGQRCWSCIPQCTFQTNQCTSTDCWCNGNGYIKKEAIDINGKRCWSCIPHCTVQKNKCTPTECSCNGTGFIKKEAIDINGKMCWSCIP